MKTFFKEIISYHHQINQKLIIQLAAHEHELTDRTIPLLSHTINAQQIWNARITGKEQLGVHEVHALKNCITLDQENYQEALRILNARDLKEKISYQNSKGIEFTNTIQEIFYHVANHFSHHKGQIISDLRQLGVTPILTDYIYYKRQ
ncbi:DinB family protein [Parvicella tangerina]|uniref:Damage-inducible protein DinB n=1 Tax=Parvicella tangerina TaxID=2829795 RepID=A0A916JP42_9FLAO|nr:DinB family protein [Parvicella tangerina]CAG5083898.1 hypothetical protein CRYO30217_02324 [Parvicella tangerina]